MDAMRREMIDSAYQLLKQDTPREVLMREVSARAGTTHAAHNPFEDVDDLVLVSSFRFMKQYTKDVQGLYASDRNGLELNLQLWERLAECSFAYPHIFNNLFFGDATAEQLGVAAAKYYDDYPEELEGMPDYITSVLQGSSMIERNAILPQRASEEGIISPEAADYLSKIDCYLYRGMLGTACNTGSLEESDAMKAEFLDLLLKTYRSQLNDGYVITTKEAPASENANDSRAGLGARPVTLISVTKE